MTMIVKRLERNLSDVKRWGIVRTLRQQSVAEHSFWVALWVPRLLRVAGVTDPRVLLAAVEYSLVHDMDEVASGDIATPFKSRLSKSDLECALRPFALSAEPLLTGMTESTMIKAAVKLIDTFEACAFLAEEANLGNNRNKNILLVIRRKLDAAAAKFQLVHGKSPWMGQSLSEYFREQLQLMTHEWADPLEGNDQ